MRPRSCFCSLSIYTYLPIINMSTSALFAVTFVCVFVALCAQDVDYPDTAREVWRNGEDLTALTGSRGGALVSYAAPRTEDDGWSNDDGVEVYAVRPRHLFARQASRSKRFFSIASPTDRFRSRYFRSTPKPNAPFSAMALLTGIAE
ncbi:uncharacterized protein LOC129597288 [Paramacrobiotus metropolitanus]|uniref:uncharacterized protein LOC129597288 n=1 Tax=Paramacrobiotus metropolitanus TaxID=2943436 RepID=UPI002445D92F|nr:uncharacterized protein LOC129597288 [Paramacrobiotus metropolitanus]